MFRKDHRVKRKLSIILLTIMVLAWFVHCDTDNNMNLALESRTSPKPSVSEAKSNLEGSDTPYESDLFIKESLSQRASGDHENTEEVIPDDKRQIEMAPPAISQVKAGPNTNNSLQEHLSDQRQKPANPLSHVIDADTVLERSKSFDSLLEKQMVVIGRTADRPEMSPGDSEENTKDIFGKVFKDPVSGMEFVLIKGGCFQMGLNDGRVYERPAHEVCLDDFYMGRHEVTQLQWKMVMGRNLSYFKGNQHPAEWVTWDDSIDFIHTLSRRSGKSYRLPTEAEWEYAARGGDKHLTCVTTSESESSQNYVWSQDNSNKQTHQVGVKKPNSFGLHDMCGNVQEWCSDWYADDYYMESPRNNPKGPSSGSYRVLRGGGWGRAAQFTRVTYRHGDEPNTRKNDIGFRLAFSAQ